MKNHFLLLLMMAASFCACSDDDDESEFGQLNGVYGNGENVLELTYSDAELAGKTAEFHTTDGEMATLKLSGIIPGETETVIANVPLAPEASGYSFTAEQEDEDRAIDLSGSVADGKWVLRVNAKFDNELLGTWQLNSSNTMEMTWETVGGEPMNLVQLRNEQGELYVTKLTTKNLVTIVLPVLEELLPLYLKEVTFAEDGNLFVTYKASGETAGGIFGDDNWQSSGMNLVHYRVQDKICCVYPNVEMIMREIETDTTIDAGILQQVLVNGIPCHFELNADVVAGQDQLYMYLDEEYLKQLVPFIRVLSVVIQEDAVLEMALGDIFVCISLREFMINLAVALENTESMEVGMNFSKIEP